MRLHLLIVLILIGLACAFPITDPSEETQKIESILTVAPNTTTQELKLSPTELSHSSTEDVADYEDQQTNVEVEGIDETEQTTQSAINDSKSIIFHIY